MSDTSQGPGWWLASDGMWYPPETASPPPPPSSQRARDFTPHAPRNGARAQRGRARHRRAAKSGKTAPGMLPPGGKKPVVRRWWFWTALALVVVLVVVGTVWASKKTHSTSSDTSTTGNPSVSGTTATTPHQSTVAAPSTTTTSERILPTAFFKCSGSAPGGVSITYGMNSSNLNGGSSLPWVSYLPVTSTAHSFTVSAQLQGADGSIKCSTAVDVNGKIVTQNGSASGTRKIAKAVVCSKSTGGWRPC